MTRLLVLIAALFISAQSHAWGKREQGILTGIVGTVIVSELIDNHRHRNHRANDIRYQANQWGRQPYAITHGAVYPARPHLCVFRTNLSTCSSL